jgi:hypothetical protein
MDELANIVGYLTLLVGSILCVQYLINVVPEWFKTERQPGIEALGIVMGAVILLFNNAAIPYGMKILRLAVVGIGYLAHERDLPIIAAPVLKQPA